MIRLITFFMLSFRYKSQTNDPYILNAQIWAVNITNPITVFRLSEKYYLHTVLVKFLEMLNRSQYIVVSIYVTFTIRHGR